MRIRVRVFILLFFFSLVCLFSYETWRIADGAESVWRIGDGGAEDREKFYAMLEEKPFGPYAFTNQSRHSILTSLLESINAELVKKGEKFTISDSHPGSCFGHFCTNVYIQAMPIAQLYDSLAAQWGYTCSNIHGFFMLGERGGADELPAEPETNGAEKGVNVLPMPVFVVAQELECMNSEEGDDIRKSVKKFLAMLEEKPFGPYTFTNQYRRDVLTSLFSEINKQLAEQGEKYTISGGYGAFTEHFCTNVYLQAMSPVKMIEYLAREWNCTWANKRGFFDLKERKGQN